MTNDTQEVLRLLGLIEICLKEGRFEMNGLKAIKKSFEIMLMATNKVIKKIPKKLN